MSLSATDKTRVRTLWSKIESRSAELGGEALGRMLVAYPQTKIYFSEWGQDLGPQTQKVKNHGAVIMASVGKAVKNIDNLVGALSQLSELHAFKLRVDPSNFKDHRGCCKDGSAFTGDVQAAFQKFLSWWCPPWEDSTTRELQKKTMLIIC
ncbi:Hemoglobin subunit alpha [Nibea albiflora]|uniref:Hemoglobin subunit alpha n=1 Tax=Nibea albiflora TaxID=240163 RepID=A0ACB7EXI8_NIBAL|nr:Hemoglobin subunit alpha [Nibea albiflora]